MIFTLGTSNRSLPEFLGELQIRSITQLIDVRSVPYSRLPWFNAPRIERWASRAGIMYRQEGKALGGASAESIGSDAYNAALQRIVDAALTEQIAIFCAEGAPEQCHRSYSVGAALLALLGVRSINILRDGTEEDILRTLSRVPKGTFGYEWKQGRMPGF